MDVSSGGAPETEVGRYLLVREGPLDWAGLGQVALRSTLDKELHWQRLKSRPAPSRACLGKKFRISRQAHMRKEVWEVTGSQVPDRTVCSMSCWQAASPSC